LEFCGRFCALLTFLRDKSRAPAAILVGVRNMYSHPMGKGRAFAAPKRLRPRRQGESEFAPNPNLFLPWTTKPRLS